jgi:hypothetical protein
MLLVIREVAILQYKPRDGTGIVSFSLYDQWLTCAQAKLLRIEPAVIITHDGGKACRVAIALMMVVSPVELLHEYE